MNVEIGRFSFFKSSEGGNLRFSEYSPKKDCVDHKICNCTKNVTIRPEGIPLQISTLCKICTTIGSRDMECRFISRFPFIETDHLQFNIRWKEDGLINPHAYFWQNPYHLKVEISKKGCSFDNVECFLGDLFFGNKVDISTLMNGHSHSKVVDLSSIDSKDLWVHRCTWGIEAMKILPQDEEFKNWWKFYNDSEELNKKIEPYLSLDFSVDKIRNIVEKDSLILTSIEKKFKFLDSIITNISETNLFKLNIIVEKETMDKEGVNVDVTTGRITIKNKV